MTDKKKDVVQETAASETLKPNALKSEMLSKLMRMVAGMTKQDLSAFIEKTLAQVGKEDETIPNFAPGNMRGISMTGGTTPKPSASTGAVREDVEELFSDEELSEDFKVKASTLFEAAVNNRLTIEVVRIQEEFDSKLEEEVESKVSEAIEEMHTQIEKYMDYVAEQWMEENKLAIETGFRLETTEEFITGLQKLFKESFIEVPEEKVDVVEEQQQLIESLERSIEELEAENIDLKQDAIKSKKESVFEVVTEGLTETEKEKMRDLSETVDYTSDEDYREKLSIIKDKYYGEGVSKKKTGTGLINEETVVGSNEDDEDEVVISGEMKPYMQAVSRTIRK